MPHVRTQLRNAVIDRLKAVFGEPRVGDMTRFLYDFQSRNLPFAGVDVAESMSPRPGPQGDRAVERRMQVGIRIAVRADDPDAIALLDLTSAEIETALARAADLGIGRIADWRCAGISMSDPVVQEEAILATAIMTYSGTILTTDTAPDRNLHP